MKDGLREVYDSHEWSFFRPVQEIVTTAPYATGTVTIAAGVVTLVGGTFPSWAAEGVLNTNSKYYTVASRGGDTSITLNDTSVTLATASSFKLGRPEVAVPDAFDAVSGDSDLNFIHGEELCDPVIQLHDTVIRRNEQSDPCFDRPVVYSIRTLKFDPTVGSRKTIAMYPTPDKAYTLRCPMILRPTMITAVNNNPVGSEALSNVILTACLAAAEMNFGDKIGLHSNRLPQLLASAVEVDRLRTSPTSLGPDMPAGESRPTSYEDWRANRIGEITLAGEVL